MNIKALLPVVAVAALSANSLATTTISGTYKWLIGTLTANVNPKTTAQSVGIKVGTTNMTVANVMVTGNPATTIYAGQAFTILNTGSQPFANTYSTLSLVAYNQYDGSGLVGRRTVPMDSTGTLTDAIGFAGVPGSSTAPAAVTLLFPKFMLGTSSCLNGMIENLSEPINSFSLAVPTTTGSGCGSVAFPSSSVVPNGFSFSANGTGSLQMVGVSTTSSVAVAGITVGNAQYYTSVILSIGNSIGF